MISTFLGILMCIWCLKRHGRKSSALLSIFGTIVCTWLYLISNWWSSWWNSYLTLGVMCLMYFMFRMGDSFYTWICEILPPIGVGLSLGGMFFTRAVIYSVMCFVVATDRHFNFMAISVCALTAWIVILFILNFFMVETMDLNEWEITQAYKYKNLKKRFLDFK